MSEYFEINIDGVIGPTHHYGGLSPGNVASLSHGKNTSYPRLAALQGLEKMKLLSDLGFKQAFFPPHPRPLLSQLKKLGFQGLPQEQIKVAAQKFPQALSYLSSSIFMWTANAGTFSPSIDSSDKKMHFVPANLNNKFHRMVEAEQTAYLMKKLLGKNSFEVHVELPQHPLFGDEGAANHTRLAPKYSKKGLHFFVYGREFMNTEDRWPERFEARQSLEASKAVARALKLSQDQVVFGKQNPDVIDQGVFHNDVIAVGNENVLFYHEKAYEFPKKTLGEIQEKYFKLHDKDLELIEVPSREVSVIDAVSSYLFNSQLVSTEEGMQLICPLECKENPNVSKYLEKVVRSSASIQEVTYVDLRQSMKNGGGPACLRQRIVVSSSEYEKINPNFLFNDFNYQLLKNWVTKNYPEKLEIHDLQNPEITLKALKAYEDLASRLNF